MLGPVAVPSPGGSTSIGSTIASATQGSILFAGAAGALAQDNSNLFWDDANNRLGIGAAGAPAFPLSVNPDADPGALPGAIGTFGRAKIGSHATDQATFAHFDHMTATNYGFAHNASGRANVNSAAGVAIIFSQGGTGQWQVDTSGFLTPLSDAAKDLGTATFRVRDARLSRDLYIDGKIRAATANSQTTVGAAGAAAAIPTPVGYLMCFVGATEYVIPYCNKA